MTRPDGVHPGEFWIADRRPPFSPELGAREAARRVGERLAHDELRRVSVAASRVREERRAAGLPFWDRELLVAEKAATRSALEELLLWTHSVTDELGVSEAGLVWHGIVTGVTTLFDRYCGTQALRVWASVRSWSGVASPRGASFSHLIGETVPISRKELRARVDARFDEMLDDIPDEEILDDEAHGQGVGVRAARPGRAERSAEMEDADVHQHLVREVHGDGSEVDRLGALVVEHDHVVASARDAAEVLLGRLEVRRGDGRQALGMLEDGGDSADEFCGVGHDTCSGVRGGFSSDSLVRAQSAGRLRRRARRSANASSRARSAGSAARSASLSSWSSLARVCSHEVGLSFERFVMRLRRAVVSSIGMS